MRLLSLLISSVLLVCGPAHALEIKMLPQSEKLKEGLVAMREGDKAKAWEILFPQAQAGDVQAMYYLGEMMIRSPEYSDNLERANKFFSVAAAKGHAGAKDMLPRIRAMIEQKANGTLPNIANTAGMPSPEEVNRVNKQLALYKSEVFRFTDTIADATEPSRLNVMVFLDRADSTSEELYRIVKSLENEFGTKIKTSFFMLVQPASWKPDTSPIGSTSLPPTGFTPDFKGQMSAKYGVNHFPAVVVRSTKGQSRTVDDLSSLSTVISSML
ncbi:hypothetical protein GIW05_00230 [Pseudomonas syringae]|uniref:hypothetical protein n=2 Tax=Pseudomonas syringae TaxID=317 RepID=UPI001F443223|nr:hypothetical protein [Pseudomonas syringae]MCF5381948.1 hypothetical protein [Pseudomonas syringae]MCF5454734.1 hypothetical protein [Pseudomonas syringae]MCF5459573.1 hypothetical protein [Pseudomonas syringae]